MCDIIHWARRLAFVTGLSFANNQTVLKGFVCHYMRGPFN